MVCFQSNEILLAKLSYKIKYRPYENLFPILLGSIIGVDLLLVSNQDKLFNIKVKAAESLSQGGLAGLIN